MIKAENSDKLFPRLIRVADEKGLTVMIKPFKSEARGLLNDTVIGLSCNLPMEEMTYTLAHEIAHYFLHYDKGDMIRSERRAEYEEQADRGGRNASGGAGCKG